MGKLANMVVDQARAWLDCKESDGTHKPIIDLYNAYKPLARGYKVKYTDAWCATFVSAVAIKLSYTDIIPTECSCNKMIALLKKKGAWVEDDSRKPNPGDLLFYDWDDDGKGDNTGRSDHVGIVETVSGGKITIIEGNYANSVKRRTLEVNGKYIRGYGVPKYDTEDKPATTKQGVCSVEIKVLKKGAKGAAVKAMQILLIGYGYSCGSKGVDGSFGAATDKALRAYQKSRGLEPDGSCGSKTWTSLLGID